MSNTKHASPAQELIDRLSQCVEGSNDERYGICYSLSEGAQKLFQGIAAKWPYYSGSVGYPIPSVFKWATSALSFDVQHERGTLWEGLQGIMRRDLCAYALTYLTEPEMPIIWTHPEIERNKENFYV